MSLIRETRLYNVIQIGLIILPKRLRWVPHNCIAHPVYEILKVLSFHGLAEDIHDSTIPEGEERTIRATDTPSNETYKKGFQDKAD